MASKLVYIMAAMITILVIIGIGLLVWSSFIERNSNGSENFPKHIVDITGLALVGSAILLLLILLILMFSGWTSCGKKIKKPIIDENNLNEIDKNLETQHRPRNCCAFDINALTSNSDSSEDCSQISLITKSAVINRTFTPLEDICPTYQRTVTSVRNKCNRKENKWVYPDMHQEVKLPAKTDGS